MKRIALFLLLASSLLFAFSPAHAGADKTKQPVNFSADELMYDRTYGIVTARGNVEAQQGETTLKADLLTYNMKDDTVIATGHVEIDDKKTGVIKSNYAQVKGDLKSGIVKDIRFIMADNSVMVAKSVENKNGNDTDFYDVSYSSCDFCTDGSRFWEIKAQKLHHDKEAQNMSGQNVTLHISDVPVFYFPYFSYPDPTVKRRSGFLIPSYRSMSTLGSGIQIPYYWEITPYTDVLFNPIIAQKRTLYSGIFRQTLPHGDFSFYGTQTKDEIGRRYSIDSALRWQINDVWSANAHLNKTSDDTYIRRYDISGYDSSDPWLESKADVTALTSNAYFALEGFKYQNLRDYVDDSHFPNDIPLVTYAYTSAPDYAGGYFSIDSSAVRLAQNDGLESSRLSGKISWKRPTMHWGGGVFDFNAFVRADGYKVEKPYDLYGTDGGDKTTGRLLPQASLKAGYPFISLQDGYSQILEPIVMGIFAPNQSNSKNIPNLDSQDLDFDDSFLFAESRFVGHDVTEPGSRADYGIKWSIYGQETGSASILFGQSYRFSKSAVFPEDSGLEDHFSDYVGRISMQPNNFLYLSYGFRLSQESFRMMRNDLQVAVGNDLLRVGAYYMYLKKPSQMVTAQEEINFWASSALTRYWSVRYNQRIDLTQGGGTIEIGGALVYEDECFKWEFRAEKDFTRDRDYQGDLTLKLYFELKPFGGFEI